MADYFKNVRIPTGEIVEVDTRNCANLDLSNISNNGLDVIKENSKNVCLNYNQITNCILEAPNGVATYSGNTITVKQGLKVLIPNGYNADGTLNNIEHTLSKDLVKTMPDYPDRFVFGVQLKNGEETLFMYSDTVYFEVNGLSERPDVSTANKYATVYVKETNKMYAKDVSTNQYVEVQTAVCGWVTTNGTAITILHLDTPFRAINYNNTQFISNQAMPSDIFINLSLQASGATYTAPADGYYVVVMIPTNLDCYFEFLSGTIQNGTYGGATVNYRNRIFCPVKKGQSITIAYRNTSVESFKFVYAQGAR